MLKMGGHSKLQMATGNLGNFGQPSTLRRDMLDFASKGGFGFGARSRPSYAPFTRLNMAGQRPQFNVQELYRAHAGLRAGTQLKMVPDHFDAVLEKPTQID